MARTRDLKPGFFENEILGADETDPLYGTLFQGLWVLADREGRLKDRPLWIKGKVFPYRTINNPDGMLQWLADHGFIVRYTVDDERYIQVVKWKKHQGSGIHPNEQESVIPPYERTYRKVTTKVESEEGSTRSLTSFPSFPSIPSCSELRSASGDAVDTSPVVDKARKNGTSPSTDKAQDDPVERRIWTDGVALLVRDGMAESVARPTLGRMVKDHGRTAVAQAVAACQAENPADSKGYMFGVLRGQGKRAAASTVGKYDPSMDVVMVELKPCPRCGDTVCLGGASCDARAEMKATGGEQ